MTQKDLYDLRGLEVKLFDIHGNKIKTKMWTPLHYAIFYRQVKTVEYFVKDLHMNLKISFDTPLTTNEFEEDTKINDIVAENKGLFGFLVAIWTRDVSIFKYLYEDLHDYL